jgi:hypothetical protein
VCLYYRPTDRAYLPNRLLEYLPSLLLGDLLLCLLLKRFTLEVGDFGIDRRSYGAMPKK